jgi:sugar phosphate isomerase/epimerase
MAKVINRIAASATGGDSKKPFEELVPQYAGMGYKKFELYATGRGSSPDYDKGVSYYRQAADELKITYSSFHLPAIDYYAAGSYETALQWMRFASQLDIPVCVFNSAQKDKYAEMIRRMALETEGLLPVLVVQIHEGRSIETLDEVEQVINSANHPKVNVLHEVGSYHAKGVSWQKVIDVFGKKIALVHLKDMVGKQSVPFGSGEIDMPALFKALDAIGYTGDFVVEMDPPDKINTHLYIRQALEYIGRIDK